MGKLGGHELNVSSDIDLVFVYTEEGETTGVEEEGRRKRKVSNHQYFVSLSENLMKFLNGSGGAEKLYRVDARLRPEGVSGPLARSIVSYENYFLTQARIWEKVAMSKARGIAGDEILIQNFEVLCRRFVYDANPIQHLLNEVWRLKEKIDHDVYKKNIAHLEVKRGYGGIREIEFQVVALQLIYGKKYISIRRRNCLEALQALLDADLIKEKQYHDLHNAYIWLRTVEHRLQYLYDQQEHSIPESDQDLEVLAKRCGIEANSNQNAALQFREKHQKITETVHRWFIDTIQPDENIVNVDSKFDELWYLLHTEIDPVKAQTVLKKYNFQSPSILKTIRRLAYGTSDQFITAEGQQFFEVIFPRLMQECMKVPFADKAVINLESFMLNSGGISRYYAILVNYPPLLRMLIKIFGSSDYLSKILIRHPGYLELLVSGETLEGEINSDKEADEVRKQVLNTKSQEIAQHRLCRFYKKQLLKIGTRFLLGISNQI